MVTSQRIGNHATCACMIIVRDSEKTIRACLDSVIRPRAFNRVIVVLDSRSRDGTAAILREYSQLYGHLTAVVYRWESEDFSAARNVALRMAFEPPPMEYGFWIDADEELPREDARWICEILADPQGAAYYISQVSPTSDGGIISVPQVRLFPLLPGVCWELPVHEQIVFSLRALGVPERPTTLKVWHTGYKSERTVAAHHKRYHTIMSDFLANYPLDDDRRRYIMDQFSNSDAYLRRPS